MQTEPPKFNEMVRMVEILVSQSTEPSCIMPEVVVALMVPVVGVVEFLTAQEEEIAEEYVTTKNIQARVAGHLF